MFDLDLIDQARRTLVIAHRWGYAPTLDALAADLVGGPVSYERMLDALHHADDILVRDGFAYLAGFDDLVEKSKRRVAAHRMHNGWARTIAEEYAHELVRTCPLIECIALSGSVASGGYDTHDDIDLDLFVVDDAKYLVYALALLLGLKTSLQHRRLVGLRKVICINVLWTRADSLPFQRRDEDLAFELLHCKPLVGASHFGRTLAANGWVQQYFPQLIAERVLEEPLPRANPIGLVVGQIARRPRLLRAANELCRVITHAVYSSVHWLTRRDATARARLIFLQRVKYPYEVFQD